MEMVTISSVTMFDNNDDKEQKDDDDDGYLLSPSYMLDTEL